MRKLHWKKYLTREYTFLYVSYAIDCYKIMHKLVGTTLKYDISHGQKELVTLYGTEDDIQNSYKLIQKLVLANPKRVEEMMQNFNLLVKDNYELFATIKRETDKQKLKKLLKKLDVTFLKTLCYYLFFVYLGYASHFKGIKAFLKKHEKTIHKIRLNAIDVDMNLMFPKLFGRFDKKLAIRTQYMTRNELLAFLRGKKIDWKKVMARKIAYLLITKNGKTREYDLLKISKAIENELGSLNLNKRRNSIRGNIACKGKVIGKARIIFTKKDYKKIKQGDIVVTSMTKPDIVPYLKKVVGIITNDGGTLSHASIISREMKIPCIVGTISATDIFKSDETILLDANAGIAKKIN